jgi:uncharacterized protein (TIGR03435 family)
VKRRAFANLCDTEYKSTMARRFCPFVAKSLAWAAFLSLSAAAQTSLGTQEVKFEVLSIKPIEPGAPMSGNTAPSPNGFVARLSVWQMVQLAYAPEYDGTSGYAEIRNVPNWSGDFYDISARVASADLKAWQNQSRQHELLRSAMRAALKERCKLAIHEQPAIQPNFELVVRKRGPRLKAAVPSSAPATVPAGGQLASGGVKVGSKINSRTVWRYYGATMGDLVSFLNIFPHGIPVRDRTGLTGRYDFTLEQIAEPLRGDDSIYNFPVDPLGLELKRSQESRPVLVIDHIEKPTAN